MTVQCLPSETSRGTALALHEERLRFLHNPEGRVPCLFLLDTSGSMRGAAFRELLHGLTLLQLALQGDRLTARRVEVAIVTFGGTVRVVQGFATVDHFDFGPLIASGSTPMSEAILLGLRMLAERGHTYNEHGISSHKPWVFLLSDGQPTDANLWREAVREVRHAERRRRLELFTIAIGDDANIEQLSELGSRPPARLRDLEFGRFFRWVSRSLDSYSRSRPGDGFRMDERDWDVINP